MVSVVRKKGIDSIQRRIKMNKKLISKGVFLTIAIIVMFILTLQGCSLQPIAWEPPIKPELTGNLAENELHQLLWNTAANF